MTKRLLIFLTFSLIYFCNAQYVATDLSYTCLGGNKYKIRLDVFTECGTNGGFVLGFQFPLYVSSEKLKASLGEIYFDKSTSPIEHIKLFCTDTPDNCSDLNSPYRGLQKFTFYKTIDLGKYAATDDWRVAFIYDFKDKVFRDLIAPEKYAHIATTQINTNDGLCNNSPQYSENPILKSCVGQTDTISLGISDPDNNNLKFSLANPITQINKVGVDMQYSTGFSKEKPLSLAQDLSITSDGKLIIKGTKINDLGAVDILIDEYDTKGNKIATTRRNIQINVLNCNNQIPVITDLANPLDPKAKNTITVCSGDTVSKLNSLFNVFDSDSKIESLQITSRNPQIFPNNILVSHPASNNKSSIIYAGDTKVPASNKDTSVIVDVYVADDGCPVAKNYKSFTIFIKAQPKFDFGYDTQFLSCSPATILDPSNMVDLDTADKIKPVNLKGNAPFVYNWKTWKITPTGQHIGNNSNIGGPTASKHTVDNFNHGVTVTITDKNGCSTSDSIYFENGLEFHPDITQRCFSNDSTVFTDASISRDTNASIIRRTWNFGDGTIHQSVNDSIVKKKYCSEGLFPVSLEIETSKGCKAKFEDSLRIYSLPTPNFEVTDHCARRIFIDDKSAFEYPIKGSLLDYKSIVYDTRYYVTKVASGIDTTIEIKTQTRAKIKIICDSVYVTFETDSAAEACTHYNITPKKKYKFNYLNIPKQALNSVFQVSETGTNLILSFKPFEFGALYKDTVLLNKPAIIYTFSKSDIVKRNLYGEIDTLIQDKKTNAFKKCVQFVQEDSLNRDIPIISAGANTYGFPRFTFDWEKQNNRIQIDSGLYLVKQTLSAQGCYVETTKEVKVLGEPEIALTDALRNTILSDTIIQNCLHGDTILYTKLLNNPNGGPLRYGWDFNSREERVNSSIFTTLDSLPAQSVGVYTVYVKDSKGCDDTASVRIISYLKPDFEAVASCDVTDKKIHFINKTKNTQGPKVQNYHWYVQDITGSVILSFDTTAMDFYKTIYSNSDIKINLLIKDALGCTKDTSKPIIRSDFKENLKLSGESFCVSDQIKAHAIDLIIDPSHIDSIVWNLGDGRTMKQLGTTQAALDNFFIKYNDDNEYKVSFKVYYNGIKVSRKDSLGQPYDSLISQCIYPSKKDTTIGIKPEFKGKVFEYRNCSGDSSEFIFEKDPTVGDRTAKVQKITWVVDAKDRSLESSLTFPITREDAYSFKEVFYNAATELLMKFTATDQNGCIFKDVGQYSIDGLNPPVILGLDSVCYGNPSTIVIRPNNRNTNQNVQTSTVFGIEYYSKEIRGMNIQTENDREASKYTFPYSGKQDIKLYAIKRFYDTKSLTSDLVKECRGIIDTSIYVRPVPTPFFSALPVCAKTDTTRFINLTSFKSKTNDAKDSTIVSYIWDFGDGSPKSNEVNPKHVYAKGGTKDVTLTAITANGCSISDTLPVGSYLSPTAFFTTLDSSTLDFKDPILFENKSLDYVKAHWDFGDGEFSDDFGNTIHRYNNIDRYKVTLTVTSDKGCKDIYIRSAELKPALILPNAFSPNGDGQNDELFLIYRLIEELEEFKIYNRWGEVVFDAQGNLNARWDGKHKGTDQELGSYVAYVKARGKYEYNYNFKQNITLLR